MVARCSPTAWSPTAAIQGRISQERRIAEHDCSYAVAEGGNQMNTALLPSARPAVAIANETRLEVAATPAVPPEGLVRPSPTRRIVCGTDFTPGAAAAADVAQILAERLESTFELVHVVDHGWMDFLPEHVHMAAGEGLRMRMDEEERRLAARGGSLLRDFRSGSADEVLIEMGEEAGTELLVLSATGRFKRAEFRVGRVAERVAESGAVPTLIVRSALPFENWASGKHSLRILVGVDFSAASDAAQRWVGKLWRLRGCEVIAVHATWPREPRAGSSRALPHGDDARYLQRILEKELQASLGMPNSGEIARVRVQPEWDRVDNGLVRVDEGYTVTNSARGDFEIAEVASELRFSKRHKEIDEKTRAVLTEHPEKRGSNAREWPLRLLCRAGGLIDGVALAQAVLLRNEVAFQAFSTARKLPWPERPRPAGS